MVTPGRRHHRYTYAQYVALERDSPTKHEFFDGEIYAMVGGLRGPLGPRRERARRAAGRRRRPPLPRARVRSADLRRGGGARDVPRRVGDLRTVATALNPLVLLEVTSDSSEEYDTGAKLEAYETIPTLREVILVSHRERRITIHRRDATGAWTMRVAIAGGRTAVESLGAELIVDAIYRHSSVP
jgi:Uma2 family endonuclease